MAESRPSIKEPKPSKKIDLETAVENAFKREAQAFGIKAKRRPAYVQQKTDEHFDAADRIVAAREKGLKEGQIDPLTQLPLRSHLTEALTKVHGLIQHGAKVDAALLILDVDYFKRINDTYGHQGGDAVLVALANLLRARKRESDTIVRYGGEEIAILLEGGAADDEGNALSPKDYANQIKDAIRAEVAKTAGLGDQKKVTVSIGFSSFKFDPENIDPDTGQPTLTSVDELIRQADRALYRAKHTGRDKVAKYTQRMLLEENVKAEETKISPEEFLELYLNYLRLNLVKEAGELNTITAGTAALHEDPQHKYSNEIIRSANDLGKYLPIIESVTRDAVAGRPVKIVNSYPDPFFYAGVLPGQEEKYKDYVTDVTFSPDQIPKIISLLDATLQARTRNDITSVTAYSELLEKEKLSPEQRQSLVPIVDTARDIDDKVYMLGSLSRQVNEDEPILISSINGQRRLVLDKAA